LPIAASHGPIRRRNRSRERGEHFHFLECISKFPQENDYATQQDETEEVACFDLSSRIDSPKSFEPGKEPLDLPALAIAAKSAAVLFSGRCSVSPVAARSDELYSSLLSQTSNERSAVISFVADKFPWESVNVGGVQRRLDEANVVEVSSTDTNSDRKTLAVCNRQDLGRTAGTAAPDEVAPFFAGT
jgi:hypothetical protein